MYNGHRLRKVRPFPQRRPLLNERFAPPWSKSFLLREAAHHNEMWDKFFLTRLIPLGRVRIHLIILIIFFIDRNMGEKRKFSSQISSLSLQRYRSMVFQKLLIDPAWFNMKNTRALYMKSSYLIISWRQDHFMHAVLSHLVLNSPHYKKYGHGRQCEDDGPKPPLS